MRLEGLGKCHLPKKESSQYLKKIASKVQSWESRVMIPMIAAALLPDEIPGLLLPCVAVMGPPAPFSFTQNACRYRVSNSCPKNPKSNGCNLGTRCGSVVQGISGFVIFEAILVVWEGCFVTSYAWTGLERKRSHPSSRVKGHSVGHDQDCHRRCERGKGGRVGWGKPDACNMVSPTGTQYLVSW